MKARAAGCSWSIRILHKIYDSWDFINGRRIPWWFLPLLWETTSCTLLQPPMFQQLPVPEHPSSKCFNHCASHSQMPVSPSCHWLYPTGSPMSSTLWASFPPSSAFPLLFMPRFPSLLTWVYSLSLLPVGPLCQLSSLTPVHACSQLEKNCKQFPLFIIYHHKVNTLLADTFKLFNEVKRILRCWELQISVEKRYIEEILFIT